MSHCPLWCPGLGTKQKSLVSLEASDPDLTNKRYCHPRLVKTPEAGDLKCEHWAGAVPPKMGHIECGAKPLLVQNGTSNVKTASNMGHVTPLPTAPDLLSTAKVLKVLSFFSFGCSSSGPEWDFQCQNCLQNGPCDTSTNCPRPTEHNQGVGSALPPLLLPGLFWAKIASQY